MHASSSEPPALSVLSASALTEAAVEAERPVRLVRLLDAIACKRRSQPPHRAGASELTEARKLARRALAHVGGEARARKVERVDEAQAERAREAARREVGAEEAPELRVLVVPASARLRAHADLSHEYLGKASLIVS